MHPTIQNIRDAADTLAAATAANTRLELHRPAEKLAAIKRLMTQPNDLTGKPHSASSAEAIVETDAEYLAYRLRQIDAEAWRLTCWGDYEAAKLVAQQAVALVSRAVLAGVEG